jgi:hypothetical protein
MKFSAFALSLLTEAKARWSWRAPLFAHPQLDDFHRYPQDTQKYGMMVACHSDKTKSSSIEFLYVRIQLRDRSLQPVTFAFVGGQKDRHQIA